MADSELDRLDPSLQIIKLSTGFSLEIQRLKTRQLFRLLKVLTHGAGPALMQSNLDFGGDPSEFGQKLMALVVMSVPDAENEFIQFLASMCQPDGLAAVRRGSKLNKQETEDNAALWLQFDEELHNPDPMDLLDVVEAIVKQEAPDIQALGKRLAALFQTFSKAGADKEKAETPPTPQELAEAEKDEEPGTSLPVDSLASSTS
jgi:ubiquinone biosynthesis protein UbiJ